MKQKEGGIYSGTAGVDSSRNFINYSSQPERNIIWYAYWRLQLSPGRSHKVIKLLVQPGRITAGMHNGASKLGTTVRVNQNS